MTQSDLARKLGIKPGMKVLVQDAPHTFSTCLGTCRRTSSWRRVKLMESTV